MAITDQQRAKELGRARAARWRRKASDHVALVRAAEANLRGERAAHTETRAALRKAEAKIIQLRDQVAQLEQAIRRVLARLPAGDRARIARAKALIEFTLALTPKLRERARKRDVRRQLLELMRRADEATAWFENDPELLRRLGNASDEPTKRALALILSFIEVRRVLRERRVPLRAFIK